MPVKDLLRVPSDTSLGNAKVSMNLTGLLYLEKS